MAEHPEIDQWWSASPVFSQLKLNGPQAIEPVASAAVLLKPLRHSGYDGYRARCSTAPGPNGAVRRLTRDDRSGAWEVDFDDYMAVAFNSGKIQISKGTTGKTVAVAYVAGRPQSLDISSDGTQLEVQADELTFFDISDMAPGSA